MQDWNKLKEILLENKKVVILSHRSPDGDSIGSSLGLYHLLKQSHNEVVVITPDPAPKFLNWMQGFEAIMSFDGQTHKATEAIKYADLIFCLDFNSLNRLGSALEMEVKKNESAYIINIDHHQQPDNFADFTLEKLYFNFKLRCITPRTTSKLYLRK